MVPTSTVSRFNALGVSLACLTCPMKFIYAFLPAITSFIVLVVMLRWGSVVCHTMHAINSISMIVRRVVP